MANRGLIGRVTSKEFNFFPMELGFFEKLRIFQEFEFEAFS